MIVKSDELVVEEVTVYKSVLRWAEKECGRRGLQVNCDERLSNTELILINDP